MPEERALHIERGEVVRVDVDAARGASLPREYDPSDSDTIAPEVTPADPHADVAADLLARTQPADVEEGGLSDEEIDAYRRRVAEGFYNTREVAAEVARRMLRSGDL